MLQGLCRFRVDGNEKILVRTGEQPVNDAFVPRSNALNQAIVSATKPLYVELLPRLDLVYSPQFCRQDDPAFGGDGNLHRSKGNNISCNS